VEAFVMLGEGLRHASQLFDKYDEEGDDRHLDAGQLVEGIVDLMATRYGLLATSVLAEWKIDSPRDIGRITFHLIEHGVLGKQPDDREEDFEGLPDFRRSVHLAVAEHIRQELV
jgi:uncharacterized repeat protein (TIGR04138 family)